MNTNMWIRKFHRWLSIAFTLAVVVNIVAQLRKEETAWIGTMALFPLILLLLSGLCLFALPYATKWRSAR